MLHSYSWAVSAHSLQYSCLKWSRRHPLHLATQEGQALDPGPPKSDSTRSKLLSRAFTGA
jgi:hypothetical protein